MCSCALVTGFPVTSLLQPSSLEARNKDVHGKAWDRLQASGKLHRAGDSLGGLMRGVLPGNCLVPKQQQLNLASTSI